MSSRWNIPPWPERGTRSADPVYRAVGVALSAWEGLELNLPRLLGAFTNTPAFKVIHDPRYAAASKFIDRIAIVKLAVEDYFLRYCNQKLEGRFHELIKEATLASRRRNDIAHGVVKTTMNIKSYRREEFLLMPSTYKAAHFDEYGFPAFLYNSQIILDFAGRFQSLCLPAMELCVALARARAGLPY